VICAELVAKLAGCAAFVSGSLFSLFSAGKNNVAPTIKKAFYMPINHVRIN
jgi:hypothetical protein